VCTSPPGDGEPCVYDSTIHSERCGAGLACVDGLCSTPPGEGEPCGESGECASGLLCHWEGICIAGAAEGEPCSYGTCNPGLVCAEEDLGVCIPLRDEGDPCGYDEECAGDLRCLRGADGYQCGYPAIGSPCRGYFDDDECGPRAYCDSRILDGLCQLDVCAGFTLGE
jgi:hypothetical protein